MSDEREEWDGPWKDALECLDLVFDLFWPNVLLEADLSKGWQSLAQELQKLTPDGGTGLLRVDKLFELTARESGDPRLAHFEAQMQKDLQLPVRMHRYGSRGRDHFNQPIGSFVILGDDDDAWMPTEHREGVFGCQQTTRFRPVKLIRWRPFLAELEAGANLFGLFVCAHLETMRTRGNVPERQEAKFRLLANLMRRDIPPVESNRWYRLIDWIMKLPEDANRAVWLRLEELKEQKTDVSRHLRRNLWPGEGHQGVAARVVPGEVPAGWAGALRGVRVRDERGPPQGAGPGGRVGPVR